MDHHSFCQDRCEFLRDISVAAFQRFLNCNTFHIPPVKFIFLSVNTASATLGSPPLLKNKKADPIGFSVLRDTNKIGRSNKFVLKTL